MSAYRQNFTPEPQQRDRKHRRLALISVALFVAAWLAVAGSERLGWFRGGAPADVVSPVRTPQVQALALEPLTANTLAAARVEAFRAGYERALQYGCRPATLAAPIAQVRP